MTLGIALIILIQLNYAVAPRLPFLWRLLPGLDRVGLQAAVDDAAAAINDRGYKRQARQSSNGKPAYCSASAAWAFGEAWR